MGAPARFASTSAACACRRRRRPRGSPPYTARATRTCTNRSVGARAPTSASSPAASATSRASIASLSEIPAISITAPTANCVPSTAATESTSTTWSPSELTRLHNRLRRFAGTSSPVAPSANSTSVAANARYPDSAQCRTSWVAYSGFPAV